jgi:hypothetical protein
MGSTDFCDASLVILEKAKNQPLPKYPRSKKALKNDYAGILLEEIKTKAAQEKKKNSTPHRYKQHPSLANPA